MLGFSSYPCRTNGAFFLNLREMILPIALNFPREQFLYRNWTCFKFSNSQWSSTIRFFTTSLRKVSQSTNLGMKFSRTFSWTLFCRAWILFCSVSGTRADSRLMTFFPNSVLSSSIATVFGRDGNSLGIVNWLRFGDISEDCVELEDPRGPSDKFPSFGSTNPPCPPADNKLELPNDGILNWVDEGTLFCSKWYFPRSERVANFGFSSTFSLIVILSKSYLAIRRRSKKWRFSASVD